MPSGRPGDSGGREGAREAFRRGGAGSMHVRKLARLSHGRFYSRDSQPMEFPKAEIETLWAPWRVEYFEQQPRDRDFLSHAATATNDATHFVIARRKTAFLMMNRYPYAVGHLMAVPYRKTADAASLGENEVVDLWNLSVHAQTLLREVMKPQGFNIGMNLGECAGAGVADHLHVHIVPRWNGDTNFMPMLTGVRTISEALQSVYEKLVAADAQLMSRST